jgi:hypothetical protein
MNVSLILAKETCKKTWKRTDMINATFMESSKNDGCLPFFRIPPNFKQQHGEGTDRSGSPTAAEISETSLTSQPKQRQNFFFSDRQKLLSIHNCSILA